MTQLRHRNTARNCPGRWWSRRRRSAGRGGTLLAALIIPEDRAWPASGALKNAKVLVIGAGGLGSPALLYLAAAGVGTIGIVDDDDVDLSNLQRQVIHGVADVGRPQDRVSARDAIAALNPLRGRRLHKVRLDAANALELFAGYDLILDGADNFATRYLVNDAAAILGKPYVWGSIFRFDGQVSVFWDSLRADLPGPLPGGAPARLRAVLRRRRRVRDAVRRSRLADGDRGGQADHRRRADPAGPRADLRRPGQMSWREMKVRKDPDAEPITELIDYEAFCGIAPAREAGSRARRGRRAARPHAGRPRVPAGAGLPAGGRAGAGGVRDRPHRRVGADPAGPDPVRRGPGRTAAGADMVFHCKVGSRSAAVLACLRRRAIQACHHLDGGILAWVRDVEPAEAGATEAAAWWLRPGRGPEVPPA